MKSKFLCPPAAGTPRPGRRIRPRAVCDAASQLRLFVNVNGTHSKIFAQILIQTLNI